MKKRTVLLIAAGVLAAHALVLYLIGGLSPLPKVRYVPPDNFSLGWAKFTDPATHEKMVYQEFTVSTQVGKAGPAAPPKP
jgi:hypothetical protein